MAAPITPDDWAAMRAAGVEQSAPAGQVLIREGSTGGSLFVVLTGSVAVTRGGRRLAELGEGAILGESAMLDGRPRTASVVVTDDATLLVVPGTAVRSLLEERPALHEHLLSVAESR